MVLTNAQRKGGHLQVDERAVHEKFWTDSRENLVLFCEDESEAGKY